MSLSEKNASQRFAMICANFEKSSDQK